MIERPNLFEAKLCLNEIIDTIRSLENLQLGKKLYLLSKTSPTGLDEENARLLQAIRQYGSISVAAKQSGKDYRMAWLKIDELEKSFGFKIVDRTLGGLGGGSAKLTLKGEILLQKYFLAMKKVQNFLDSEEVTKPNLSIMGSHCYALEILVDIMEATYKNFFVEYINVGSENGIKLVLANMADISGVHLFDQVSGQYNDFLLKDPSFGKKIALIKGYSRIQGIILSKGNPKKIHSIDDILRKDVVFINRNLGSGTRILLDSMINKMALKGGLSFGKMVGEIRGYSNEVRSHFEVAIAIRNGKADMGVGIKSVAKLLELDFIPIQNERFDFVVLREKIKEEKIVKFIKTLTSKHFNAEIHEKNLGIEFDDRIGQILSD